MRLPLLLALVCALAACAVLSVTAADSDAAVLRPISRLVSWGMALQRQRSDTTAVASTDIAAAATTLATVAPTAGAPAATLPLMRPY